MLSDLLPVKGVKAITYLVSCQDKLTVLSVLCSLLNTVGCDIAPQGENIFLTINASRL